MAELLPLSRETHKTSKIRLTGSFQFTKNQNLCPILIPECPLIMSQSPIIFAKDENENFLTCSLLGLIQNTNSFVDEQGNWKKPFYIPALFRAYPFSLGRSDRNKQVLCLDNSENILSSDSEAKGLELFKKDGSNSDHLNKVLSLLNAIEEQKKQIASALGVITSLELLEEWDVKIKHADKEHKLKGLWKINRGKFNSLNEKRFNSLRDFSTMDLIFSHFFSLQSLKVVGKLLDPSNNQNETSLSFKDRAINKQKTESALELDNLVKNLLLDE